MRNAAASRENDIGCSEFPDPAGKFAAGEIRARIIPGSTRRVVLPPGLTCEKVQAILEKRAKRIGLEKMTEADLARTGRCRQSRLTR